MIETWPVSTQPVSDSSAETAPLLLTLTVALSTESK
jgi:hypothetical protein